MYVVRERIVAVLDGGSKEPVSSINRTDFLMILFCSWTDVDEGRRVAATEDSLAASV
jgi:hypothetical protein